MTSLATLDDFFAYRGEDTTIQQDHEAVMRAQLALEAASEAVRRYCRRDFDYSTGDIRVDGTGTDAVFVPNPPIVEVTTASVFTYQGATETETELEDHALTVDNAAGIVYLADGCAWPEGKRNIGLNVTQGYRLPDDESVYDPEPDPIPADLAQAVVVIATSMLTEGTNTTGGGDIIEQTIGSYSERRETTTDSSPQGTDRSQALNTLNRYRLVSP